MLLRVRLTGLLQPAGGASGVVLTVAPACRTLQSSFLGTVTRHLCLGDDFCSHCKRFRRLSAVPVLIPVLKGSGRER